MMSQVQKLS